MIKTIDFSKIYTLSILSLYGGEKINCTVIGKTNIDNVANNEDNYNIYERFFSPVGLGMTSYYSVIRPSTTIYICKLVESLEPLEIKDEKVFIPETLIDMDKSIEYVECDNFNFTIFPLMRRFTNEEERINFIKEITEKTKLKLRELIDFSLIDNEITVSYNPIYVAKEEIDNIETARSKAFNDYISRQKQMITRQHENEREFNIKLNEMNDMKNRYQIQLENTRNQEHLLKLATEEYERLIENMKK